MEEEHDCSSRVKEKASPFSSHTYETNSGTRMGHKKHVLSNEQKLWKLRQQKQLKNSIYTINQEPNKNNIDR